MVISCKLLQILEEDLQPWPNASCGLSKAGHPRCGTEWARTPAVTSAFAGSYLPPRSRGALDGRSNWTRRVSQRGTSTLSRRETISHGKLNRLKTFRPAFRPGGEGPHCLHRGSESGAKASDDSDDRALPRSRRTAVIPCRVRAGVRGTRHVCLEVGLICTSSTEKCSRRDLNPCQKLERLLSLATRLRERGDALRGKRA